MYARAAGTRVAEALGRLIVAGARISPVCFPQCQGEKSARARARPTPTPPRLRAYTRREACGGCRTTARSFKAAGWRNGGEVWVMLKKWSIG